MPSKSIIFLSSIQPQNRYAPENYQPLSPENLEKYQQLPEVTREYYAKCQSEGLNPLMYVGVPHVLFFGQLNITDFEILEVK